jgi:hypothetical protein
VRLKERIYLIYACVKSAQADLTREQIKTPAQLTLAQLIAAACVARLSCDGRISNVRHRLKGRPPVDPVGS